MTTQTQRIAIGDGFHSAEWLISTRAGQLILKEAYESARRPRCCCRQEGVEMYIGRRGKRYYLSRMPGTGFLHSESCSSVETSSILSGAQCYTQGVMTENEKGELCLIADLALLDRQPPPLNAIGVDGLLDLLIELADLNRIQPEEPQRTWQSVREKLLSTASLVCIGETPLAELLFLPEHYTPENSAAVLSNCESMLSGERGFALVLAPLKEIRMTTYSWQVVLKHLRGLRLWASKELGASLEARWRIPYFNSNPDYGFCLLVARPARRAGNFTVTNMAILPTDVNFFPCQSDREKEVVAELISEGRSVLRPLRFENPVENIFADFALLDENEPIPVFVLAPTGDEVADTAKRSFASLMVRNHAQVKVFKE